MKINCNVTLPMGDGENRRELGRKEKEKPKSKVLMS